MKLKLLLVFLLVSTLSRSQELFSDAFLTQVPFSLLTINGQLYVSTANAANDQPVGIFRLDFDDPNTINLVAETPDIGLGPLYMAYDPDSNSIFALIIGQIIRIDLNQPLPITFETLIEDNGIAFNEGLVYNDGFVYYRTGNSINRLASSGGNPEVIITPDNANTFAIAQIFDNELYYIKLNDENGPNLFKVNLSNPIEILVSNLDGLSGFVQSSYLTNNFLYIGFEVTGDDPIIRLDLSQETPLQPETIIEDVDFAALGMTGYLNDLYYSDAGPQSIFRIQDGLLNISEFENRSFDIFPNPTQNQLFITSQIQESIEYKIFDILGKNILIGVYQDSGIDLSHLNNGTYFVTITTNDGITNTQKIIKN